MDEDIPFTDDLEKLGFQFSSDGESMYYQLKINGPQVLVGIETNSHADDYCMAKSLGLYFKGSTNWSIRDNPTIKQIKTLIAALEGTD